MPANTDDSSAPATLRDWFDASRYRTIADQLAAACPGFRRPQFLDLTLTGLAERSLMDRLRQTALAADAALPGSYAEKLEVLRTIAPANDHGFVGIWFSEFAGRFGADEPARALAALRHFTRFGSAEFAVRPFLLRDPETTLAVLLEWTADPNEHVRRLASEGSRPRLPWGLRLGFLLDDPRPTRAILEALRNDPSLYVRKSVANHLNDIAKDHADYVVDLVAGWDRRAPPTRALVRQGLRTLVKRGHPGALALLGAGAAPAVRVVRFAASPAALALGERLELQLDLRATAPGRQRLVIDYAVHYVKANGTTSAKVFKWKEIELDATDGLSLRKGQRIQDFSTRRHYPGRHRVSLQINGRTLAETAFTLR